MKLATDLDDYFFPITLNRCAIANILMDFSPLRVMRAMIANLVITVLLVIETPAPTTDKEPEVLSCAVFDTIYSLDSRTTETQARGTTFRLIASLNSDGLVAQVVTRKGRKRWLESGNLTHIRKSRTPTPSPPSYNITTSKIPNLRCAIPFDASL